VISIAKNIYIEDERIKYKAIKSSGSGGQNINKVSTAIILQYELFYKDYPKWFIQNLENNFANKISKKNILTIKKNKHRSQLTNKKEALNKLKQIFKISAKKKDFRLKTLVPFKSKMKRSSLKIRNSKKKELRKTPKIEY
jgi:ribosome-associated protein